MNYLKLSLELKNDPDGIGYSVMTDQQAADALNVVDKSRNRTSMSRQEIYENIDAGELALLTALEVAQVTMALSDTVDPFGNAESVFINVFGPGSITIQSLAAARVETVSRAVQIGLSIIQTEDVRIARSQ